MPLAALHKTLKTLADPTRVRLLALLDQEELAVQELTRILDLAQSTVSRHLGVLREAGLVQDRREGTRIYYRASKGPRRELEEIWRLVESELRTDPIAARDRAALQSVLRARAVRTRRWFEAVGPEWDGLRRVFHDDTQRARAIARLVPRGLRVADIGTGTGILAQELAAAGLRVVAIDISERMLRAARRHAAGVVELVQAEAESLPLADAVLDAAFAHMVLHSVASPAEAIREMARVVRAGGKVVMVDFVRHDREWMKERTGAQWLGFEPAQVRGWLLAAGLDRPTIEVHEDAEADLPATFIASATRPSADDVRT